MHVSKLDPLKPNLHNIFEPIPIVIPFQHMQTLTLASVLAKAIAVDRLWKLARYP